jgi:hypothetical protein
VWWREGRQLFYSKEKRRVLSKSKVDFLILFACSIPSTAAGGSLYMSFIHFTGLQVESISQHRESSNHKYWALQSSSGHNWV